MGWLLYLIIFFYVLTCVGDLILEFLNLNHLKKHGAEVPAEFVGVIDAEKLQKVNNYTFANSRFNMIHAVYNELITVIFIFGGILTWYNETLYNYHLKYSWHFAVWGVIFVMLLSYAKTFLNIPFNLYQTFNIERRFGFNTMSIFLWLGDLVKSLLVSTVLMSAILFGAFWLIHILESEWWIPVWALFFVFTLFLIYISPYVLAPLFNKFTPIKDEDLADEIIKLLAKSGITVSGVYSMDASKRTKHSNAYFTGMGKVKRIVIFDNLLERLSKEELMAVLAHEAGHCRKKHIIKNLIIFEVLSAVGIFIAYKLLESDILVKIFNLEIDTFFAKMIVLSFIAGIILWAMPLFFNAISRHFERQADDFAVKLIGSGKPLADALVKLSVDNLANLYPQKLYAYFNYSHPPVLQRIKRLRNNNK